MKITAFLFLASLPILQASPLATGLSGRSTTSKSTDKGSTAVSVYNVLKPNTGCIPGTCGTCKRDATLLPRADAPTTPAEKTEAGLNGWTKAVFGSPSKELDIGNAPVPAAQFFTWDKLGDAKFVTLAGLFGCASVVVVSDAGVYMASPDFPRCQLLHTLKSGGLEVCVSLIKNANDDEQTHHWDNTVSDTALRKFPTMFANSFTNALKGSGRATPTKNELAEGKVGAEFFDEFYPTRGWLSLTGAAQKQCFDAKNKPQAVVVVHNGLNEDGEENSAQFVKTAPKMQALVKELVPAATPKIVIYKDANSQIQRAAAAPAKAPSQAGSDSDSQGSEKQGSTTSKGSSSTASSASTDLADYHGKIIVSYDSKTKKYEVWMAGASLTAPILKSA